MIVQESDKSISKNTFTLPEKDDNNFEVFRYLCKERKIDKDVVAYFISKEQIYQDKKFHNVVFVGYDGTRPAYAFKRSITGNFKQDASGSDKAYSFSFKNPESDTLHVFEAAIDLLSYMSLLRMNHIDFRKDMRVAFQGGHALIGGLAEIAEYQVAGKQIDGIMVHRSAEKAGEYHRHDEELKHGGEQAPADAQHRALILELKVALDQLFEKELILLDALCDTLEQIQMGTPPKLTVMILTRYT